MDAPSTMVDCIEETGKILIINNQGIVKYLCGIDEERNHLDVIIKKQYDERNQLELEIETLTYKLCLINKSLAMRIKTKNNYDKTIEEIKSHYERLVESSNKLKQIVEKTQIDLDSIMNKKVGTAKVCAAANKSSGVLEEPTKEKWSHDSPAKWQNILKMSQEELEKANNNNKDGTRMTNNGIKPFEMKAVDEQIAGSSTNGSTKARGSAERETGQGSTSEVKKSSDNDNTSGNNKAHGSVEKAADDQISSSSNVASSLSQEIEYYKGETSNSDLEPSENNKSDSVTKL
ncbi:unnamed protein product [Ceutorhynchus assimilis]|uniref:Uncharacterized protein n=1 Tax=Ceutorhynchus assimilis TaxID=467358 RepID=A0A9N9QEZ9_9CUCU|nr:unnamed protein product [Ceutorhynchus assimilis]